jgi:hypothetical protein
MSAILNLMDDLSRKPPFYDEITAPHFPNAPAVNESFNLAATEDLAKEFANRPRYRQLVDAGQIPVNLETTNVALHEHLSNGGVFEFIANGATTFERLARIHESNPEALVALRHFNFIEAVKAGALSVEQVGRMPHDQLKQLESTATGATLVDAIERQVGPDPNRPIPRSEPPAGPEDLTTSPVPPPPRPPSPLLGS